MVGVARTGRHAGMLEAGQEREGDQYRHHRWTSFRIDDQPWSGSRVKYDAA
jgi:hypothetical protein